VATIPIRVFSTTPPSTVSMVIEKRSMFGAWPSRDARTIIAMTVISAAAAAFQHAVAR
jgi:hypothetical protein